MPSPITALPVGAGREVAAGPWSPPRLSVLGGVNPARGRPKKFGHVDLLVEIVRCRRRW